MSDFGVPCQPNSLYQALGSYIINIPTQAIYNKQEKEWRQCITLLETPSSLKNKQWETINEDDKICRNNTYNPFNILIPKPNLVEDQTQEFPINTIIIFYQIDLHQACL